MPPLEAVDDDGIITSALCPSEDFKAQETEIKRRKIVAEKEFEQSQSVNELQGPEQSLTDKATSKLINSTSRKLHAFASALEGNSPTNIDNGQSNLEDIFAL